MSDDYDHRLDEMYAKSESYQAELDDIRSGTDSPFETDYASPLEMLFVAPGKPLNWWQLWRARHWKGKGWTQLGATEDKGE